MQASQGALSHNDILNLPYCVFLSYVESINEDNQMQKNMQYFNGSEKLARQWQEIKGR